MGNRLSDYLSRVNAAYDAARTTIENERWWAAADGLSARAANSRSVRRIIRQRARYECLESNSYARGILLSKVCDIIGSGPTLQAVSADQTLDDVIELEFSRWADSVSLAEKLWAACTSYIVDGEVFLEAITNDSLSPVTFDFVVSEADLWTDPSDFGADPLYDDGIRYSPAGVPISYRRLSSHPGDPGASVATFSRSVTLPASAVFHIFRADRPGQRRGISHFAPALPLFAELRRFRLATIAAAEIAASFSGVMETSVPIEADEVEGFSTIDLERRALLTLPSGWKLSQLRAEHPSTTHNDFVESLLSEIARVTQTPLNIALGTSKDHNFASARLDYLVYHAHNDVERNTRWRRVCNWIYSHWLAEAIAAGVLPSAARDVRINWIWPPRPPIDIEAQAKADQIYFHLGLLADEDVFSRIGADTERQYEKLSRTVQRRSEIGLPIPGRTQPS